MNENVLSYQIIQVQFNKKGSLSQALRAKIPQKSYSLHKAILLTKSPVFSLRQSKKISSKEHFIVKREIKTIFKMDRILDHIFRWYCCPVLECCWSLCKPCCRFFWKGYCWCCWCCGCCTGKELNCYEILCECLEEGVIDSQPAGNGGGGASAIVYNIRNPVDVTCNHGDGGGDGCGGGGDGFDGVGGEIFC